MSAASGWGLPDLRARVLGGLGLGGRIAGGLQLTRAVVAIAVARLLTPEEYGLAALALVFASLVLVFSDLALGAALIQRKDAERAGPRHGVLGHDRRAACSSRCSASRCPARSPRSTASPTPQPLLAVLSLELPGQRARAPRSSR